MSLVLTQTQVHTDQTALLKSHTHTHTVLFSFVSQCQTICLQLPVLFHLSRVNIFCVPKISPGLYISISATSCIDFLFTFNRLACVHCFIRCIGQIGLPPPSYTHLHHCNAHTSGVSFLFSEHIDKEKMQ